MENKSGKKIFLAADLLYSYPSFYLRIIIKISLFIVSVVNFMRNLFIKVYYRQVGKKILYYPFHWGCLRTDSPRYNGGGIIKKKQIKENLWQVLAITHFKDEIENYQKAVKIRHENQLSKQSDTGYKGFKDTSLIFFRVLSGYKTWLKWTWVLILGSSSEHCFCKNEH